MFRITMSLFCAAGLALLSTGCSGSSSPAVTPKSMGKDIKDSAKDAAKDIKDTAKDAVEAGKEGLAKLADVTTKELPAIQTKINGLSGEAKTKATSAYEALKKALEDAKETVTDSEKWKAAWENITTKLAELKKQVGL